MARIRSLLILSSVFIFPFVISAQSFAVQPSFDMGGSKPLIQVEPLNVVPDAFKKDFMLIAPSRNMVVYSNKVDIVGINKFKTPVFINGKKYVPNAKGQFKATLEFPNAYSKQVVWISIITPEKKVVTVKRHLVILPKTKDMASYLRTAAAPLTFLKTFYSPLFYTPERTLGSSVSKAEFAFVLAQIFGLIQPQDFKQTFVDIIDVAQQNPLEQPVQLALSKNWMTLDAYQCFYPNQSITKGFFYTTVSTVFGSFLEVNPQLFSAKPVMTFGEMVSFFSTMPAVKQQLNVMDNTDEGFSLSEQTKLIWIKSILDEVNSL